jgi:hypothetical protein
MRSSLFALLGGLSVVGCTSTLPSPNPSVVEKEIVQSTLKELCAAVLNIQGLHSEGNSSVRGQHLSPNDGWIAEIETSLRTDFEAAVNPSATLIGPILPAALVPKGGTAGSYNAAVGGTMDQTATTLRDNKHYLVVQALMNDPEVCPPAGTPLYNAYFEEGAEYQSRGKYLSGKLGIRDWLYNGVVAQNFDSLINPTTQILQGPPVSEPKIKFISAKSAEELSAPCADCPRPIKPISSAILTQGSTINLPIAFKDPKGLKLSYDVKVSPPDGGAAPNWIRFSPDYQNLIVGPVPATATFSNIVVTATNTNSQKNAETIAIIIAATPKATTWGPTYSATFTFIIKANGLFGPSFTLDRVKGGAANLFSMTRTETNFVNMALTAVGVPLIEYNAAGALVAGATPGNVDFVNAAVRRLDDALLRLNLLSLSNPPP